MDGKTSVRRPSYSTLAAAALVGACIVLSPIGAAQGAEKFILAHAVPEDHFVHKVSVAFIDKLKETSGNQLEVEYHPGGDLGDWVVQFEQVMLGSIPMSITWGASEFDKRLDLWALGYVVDSWDTARITFAPDGPMKPVFDEIFTDLKMKLIAAVPVGFYGMAFRKGESRLPTNFPDDCRGLKLRVPNMPIAVKRFEALGCSPIPMPWAELYTALQLGTVDGRTFGTPHEFWLHRDVLQSVIYTRDSFEIAFWLANLDWWNGLSTDEQRAINEAAQHAVSLAWSLAEQESAEMLKKVEDYGVKVVELTPEQLEQVKTTVYETEWPWMEQQIGAELMSKIKAAAGRQ